MKILSRYVLREFLVPVAYCLVTFTGVYVIFDLFDKHARLAEVRPPLRLILLYYVGYVAPYVEWLLPAALLLGALYTTWQLSRHSEIIAMKANGIGFGTITAPMLATATVLAILSALNSEFYAPQAQTTARRLVLNEFQPLPPNVREDVPYNNYASHRVWRIDHLDLDDPGRLKGVRVTHENANGTPREVLSSPRAEYLDGAWWFFNPVLTRYDANGELAVTQPEALRNRVLICQPDYDEQPRDFALEANMLSAQDMKLSQAFSLRDLRRYIEARPNLPRRIQIERLCDIQYRLASPWACVVITLFAIPTGVASGRQSVFKGVLVALSLFLGFYAVTQTCLVLGKREILPIVTSAWLPNLLFLCAGFGLFLRQSR